MKNQIEAFKGQLTSYQCRGDFAKEGDEMSIKKTLLDNTFYEQCNFRYYMRYLKGNVRYNFASFADTQKKNPGTFSRSYGAEEMATILTNMESEADTAIEHTKEVYPKALVAFSEFERAYVPHIMLVFIYDDYIQLRSNMKKLFNPIGQVLYKIPNAQKK